MPKTKFSVIIPTFNSQKYITECITSVLEQSLQSFEIIIIDNNSSDNTVKIVKEFDCEKIKIFTNENFGIIATSRNYGIQKASGDYVAFLDSDDTWHKDKLEVCASHLGNYDFVCHKMDGLTPVKINFLRKKLSFFNLFLLGNKIATSSVVVRKSIVKNLGAFSENRSLVTVEDYDLWLKIARQKVKMYSIERSLGLYRYHENNSSNYQSYSRALNYLISKWKEEIPTPLVVFRKLLLRYELRKML